MKARYLFSAIVLTLTLTSCDYIKDIFLPSSSTTTTTTTSESSTTSVNNPLHQKFEHVFFKEDFQKEGGQTTINGATFTYSPFTYLSGYWGNGLQIGSTSNPQKETWSLTCSFDEQITLKSMQMYLTNAQNGGGIYQIDINNDTIEGEFNIANDPQEFTHSNLNYSTNSFTINLSSTKNGAIYFYSLAFEIEVIPGSKINVTTDNLSRESTLPGQGEIPELNYELVSIDEYYKDIDLTLTGDKLKNELNSLKDNIEYVSYDDAKYMLQYTDEDLNNPGYMYGLFDGDLIPQRWDGGSSWQREHVWACARMHIADDARPSASTKNHSSDLHNLRVACRGVNLYHSDKYYSTIPSSESIFPNVTHDDVTGMHTYQGDHRGDVARILFYMYVTYDELILTDNANQMEDDKNANYKYSMGILSSLIEWNNLDPVDDFEKQRNDRIYQYQHNRNPFIDYPSLVESLFD